MNVLLLYPEFPDTFLGFKHALKFIRKKAVSPPLGLLTVAAMLPKEWAKRLVDLNVAKLTGEDLAWADYALISGMVIQKDSARLVIAQCKEAGVKVVAGMLQTPPGTKLHKRLRQENRVWCQIS